MISLQDAIQSVLASEDPDTAIDLNHVIKRDYGWVFFPNSREYIETGNIMAMRIGSGGTLVLKADGRQIRFGSAFSVDENLHIYELGYFDHADWDLVITRIIDERESLDVICSLGIQYVVPTVQSGIEWRVPQQYTRKQIKDMIRATPLRLNVGCIYFKWKSFEKLKDQRYFEYRLEPNVGYRNDPNE